MRQVLAPYVKVAKAVLKGYVIALIGSNKPELSLIEIDSHNYIIPEVVKRFFAL